jgi:prefoldin subunit 5
MECAAHRRIYGPAQGKDVDKVIAEFNERHSSLKVLDNQLMQRKARLLTKLPEIQKACDLIVKLVEAQGEQMTLDFELAPNVYSKAKVNDVKSVNLWLGAGVMVEYELEEARELLENNLATCKQNLATTNSDIDMIKESTTTTEVSIARIYNYDVERRRKEKEAEAAAA